MTKSKTTLGVLAASVAFLAITLPGNAAPPTEKDWAFLAAAKEAMPRLEEVMTSIGTNCTDEKALKTTCLQALDTSIADLYVVRRTFAEVTAPDCLRASADKINKVVRAYSDGFQAMRTAITTDERAALNASLQFMGDGQRYMKEALALMKTGAPTCHFKD